MIPLFKVYMPEEVDKPLLETLHSGYITQGKKVEQFEARFTEIARSPHTVSVNSGTSALTLALRLAGVGVGDEVITTPMTCSATNLPILSLGGIPTFADIYSDTGLINPFEVEKLITPKTKAIMAVDWGGLPVNVSQLQAIANVHKIKLIVDAAHAIGTPHNAEADFVCYSLQAIKHITTVDGGMLICKDYADYQRAKKLRWFGINRDSNSLDSRIDEDITEWGYKFHMNDVAATIGLVQLDHVARVVKAHQLNAAYLFNEIKDREFYQHPPFEGTFWLYTLLLPSEQLRDEFKVFMANRGIQVSQVHKRNDKYTVFMPYAVDHYEYQEGDEEADGSPVQKVFPGVDNFSSRMICVPVHHGLTMADLHKITQACNSFATEHKK